MDFSYEGGRLRVTVVGGEAWFRLRDVTAIFGIRLTEYNCEPDVRADLDATVAEREMYDLIHSSARPGFNPFYRWLMSAVAPALSEAGSPLEGEPEEQETDYRGQAEEQRRRNAARHEEEAEELGSGPETEAIMRSVPGARAGRGRARYLGGPKSLS